MRRTKRVATSHASPSSREGWEPLHGWMRVAGCVPLVGIIAGEVLLYLGTGILG